MNDGVAGEMGISESVSLLSQMMRSFWASMLVRNSLMGMDTLYPSAILSQ